MRWTRTGFLEKGHFAVYYSDHPIKFHSRPKKKLAAIGFKDLDERLVLCIREEVEKTAEPEKHTFNEAVG